MTMKKSHRRTLPQIGKCFDHLGGEFAPALFDRLIEMKWIELKEGKKTVFKATEKGRSKFKEVFGIDIDNLRQGDIDRIPT